MKSVWSSVVKMPSFDALSEDKKTDVLIIGGGIAGILCAYELEKRNVDYILVEADRLCGGVTENTTAKITAQHGLIYNKIVSQYSYEKAKLYLEANLNAYEKYRRLCREIDCDFEEKNSYVYSVDSRKKLRDEYEVLNKIGHSTQLVDGVPLPVSVVGALNFGTQAQFNPLAFLAEISKDLNIYENTKVIEMASPDMAVTNGGRIVADKIIVATHFPFINKHGSYFIKMYQHRSYVIAYENAPQVDGMYVDEDDKGLSFRNYDKLLLVGGGDHRTGKNGGNYAEIESFVRRNFASAREKYRWATQDCMTLDGIAYIGRYSKNTPGFYVATGFNKWGMTTAMAAADILADEVTGKSNKYSELFSPSRTMLHPQLAVNAFHAVSGLVSPTGKRCPHLGCALKWNKVEHTWDCPCHGSRFTQSGEVIDNPATDNLTD